MCLCDSIRSPRSHLKQPFLTFTTLLYIPLSLFISILLIAGRLVSAQQVDSIYFHLYTDSLKKGRHNYINVDGKLANGRWLPLTEKEVIFSADKGKFEGNDLVLPAVMTEEKVTVTAVLRSKPEMKIVRTIWIKTLPEPDKLPEHQDELPTKRNKHT